MQRLIQQISRDNPLWGAPQIHGELLKLKIVVCQSTIAIHGARAKKPVSKLANLMHNHAQGIAADAIVLVTNGNLLLERIKQCRFSNRLLHMCKLSQ